MGSPRFIMAMSIYSYTGLPGQCGCRLIVSDNFHSCFFIPDLCGCRLCASDMSGLMRLLIYASVGLFSRLRRFFQAISARFCAPFQFFTVQDLVRGECDVWYFTNTILLLFRFLSFTPFMWGSSRWSTLSG